MSDTLIGFSEESLQFLAELAENNNKAWFAENKTRYERVLLAPAVAFVTAVGQHLRPIAPHIITDTRTNGSGSLMRLHRDTRFSADKSPYKTNIAGMWWEGGGKKTTRPAFGFQLNTAGLALMAGMFQFDKKQLQAYREAVADDTLGKALEEAITAVQNNPPAGVTYDLMGAHYKRVPQGYDADHPRADLLKHNALYVHPRPVIAPEVVTSDGLLAVCLAHFQQMAPIQQWLVQVMN